MEDLEPIAGGNQYLTPLNMGTVGQQQSLTVEPAASTTHASPTAETFRPMLADAARRIVAKETKAITNAFKRRSKEPNANSFAEWLREFYGAEASYVEKILTPAFAAAGKAMGIPYAGLASEFAQAHCAARHSELTAMRDHPQGIPGLLANWQESKADAITEELMTLLERRTTNER
jgi:hypothetical protein